MHTTLTVENLVDDARITAVTAAITSTGARVTAIDTVSSMASIHAPIIGCRQFTIDGIVDHAHLGQIIDQINTLARVTDTPPLTKD